jgi:hypothetical protein
MAFHLQGKILHAKRILSSGIYFEKTASATGDLEVCGMNRAGQILPTQVKTRPPGVFFPPLK